uniref:Hint domain-containing protein n=1 Tax=Panagrolaimus sp. ES5 TaxID=591445 RepID=A0AC34FQ49_9BILA
MFQHVSQRKLKLFQAPIFNAANNTASTTIPTTTNKPAETTFIPAAWNSNNSSEDHAVDFSGPKISDTPLPIEAAETTTTKKPKTTTSKMSDEYDDDYDNEDAGDHDVDFAFQAPLPPYNQFPPPGAAGANSCFSGDTLVKVLNGNEKRMDELEIGEWILTAGDNRIGYSRVISWLHRMPNIKSEFVKISLENGRSLKLTKKHFIYKIDCSANETRNYSYSLIEAEKIQLSDCLLSLTQNTRLSPTRISKIEIIHETGIYAPLTDSGNITVNGIFAIYVVNATASWMRVVLKIEQTIIMQIYQQVSA